METTSWVEGVRTARAALWIAAAMTGATPVQSQEALPDFYKEPGIYPNREYLDQHATEIVDPFTGALQVHVVDVRLPGPGGFDLEVVRSYNSARVNQLNPADARTASLAGLGWTVHFGRVLKNGNTNICLNTNAIAIGDNPVVELPDGSRQALSFTTSGSPLMQSTQRWRADCLGAGTGLAVYSPDGIRYDMTHIVQEVGGPSPVYAWYVRTITDRNGNTATINYSASASPQIMSVTANDGRFITFSYFGSGTAGRRISGVSAEGRTWNYSYQAVSGVADRYFLTGVSRPTSPTTSWGYAYNGAVGTDHPANFLLRRLEYPQGGALTYGYGHVHFDSVSNPASRSAVVTSKAATDGGQWSFSYSPGSANVFDTTTVATPSGTISYSHVGANYATSGSVWRIGLLMRKAIGTLQTETYSWGSQQISEENNLRQGAFPSRVDTEVYAPILTQKAIVRDGVSYRTTYSNHDSYGNPRTVVEAGPNGGNRTTNLSYFISTGRWIIRRVDDETTVGVGAVSRTWDGSGNMRSETRDGVATQFTYDSRGNVLSRTDARGFQTSYGSYFRGIPQNETQPEGVYLTRVVDDAGNVTSETDGELQTTGYTYDGLNRLTGVTPPIGNATTIAYTATNSTATRGGLQRVAVQDGFGRTTQVTVGGQTARAAYDGLGRKTFASAVGSTSVGQVFEYDILDRVTRITHNADASYRTFAYGAVSGVPTLTVRDELGQLTTYTYRGYGDPTRLELMGITAPVAAANVSIARNGRGLVTSATQGGFVRQFSYNASNFLVSALQPEVGTTTYGRDAVGNMTNRTVGTSGTTTYTYDGRNRVVRVTYPGGTPSQVTNAYWRTDKLRTSTNAVATRSYAYDANQNLVAEAIAIDGLTLAASYNYNVNDQLRSIVYPVLGNTIRLNPDVLGRPQSVEAPPQGVMFTASYWPNGQIAAVDFAGGSRLAYGQNARRWISSVTVQTAGAVNRIASALSYDAAGNLVGVADGVDASYNRTLTYDALDRLRRATGPWGTGVVTYDGAGNVRSHVLGAETRTYLHDTRNRLDTVTRDFGTAGSTTYTIGYDVYGNARNAAGDSYSFDQASNLVSTASGRRFSYDGTNTRVKTTFASVTTYEFRSAHGLLLARWRKQSGAYDVLEEHVHVAGRALAERRTEFQGTTERAPVWTFLHPDAGGAPIAGTSAAGALLFKENYEPFGSQINATAPGRTVRGFAGHVQDTAELLHMGARYYNPLTYRFASIDPKEADAGQAQGLNRYAYANQNPYRYVDPDGHTPVDLAFFAVDALRLGAAVAGGGNVAGAAADLAISAIGVLSPVPGSGQALKALKAADRVVDAAKPLEGVAAGANTIGAAKGRNFAGGQSREQRLRDLANDDKVSSADRGWIKQEMNEVAAGKKGHIRNPPGKDLAHERGRENAKGYGYEHSDLQNRADHRTQHKLDNWGRSNSERPLP